MNPLVEKFINEKRIEERKIFEQTKKNNLIKLGLAEKVYADNGQNEWTEKFPFVENVGGSVRYYKQIPIDVTDEEYAEIMKVSSRINIDEDEGNSIFSNVGEKLKSISVFFCWLGVILSVILAIIMFVIAGSSEEGIYTGIGFAWLIFGSLSSWVSSAFIYGFGELVERTREIAQNTRK